MVRVYIPPKASPVERFGLFFCGGVILAIISTQVFFLVWLIG